MAEIRGSANGSCVRSRLGRAAPNQTAPFPTRGFLLTRLSDGTVKANEYRSFSASNLAERVGDSSAKTVELPPAPPAGSIEFSLTMPLDQPEERVGAAARSAMAKTMGAEQGRPAIIGFLSSSIDRHWPTALTP